MNLLQQIVARKHDEIVAARETVSLKELQERIPDASPPRGFAAALAEEGVQLIAEVKKASPSVGLIRPNFDPVAIAQEYEQHGAACVSVLTDQVGFQGSLDDLIRVRDAIALPVLRKDFLLDPYQVLEARAAGADAVLLIAECLEQNLLQTLFTLARDLGMDVLVELYDDRNLPRVLDLGPRLVGINNRNLQNFETRLEHTLDLLDQIPGHVTVVSESGIRTPDDIQRLQAADVGAVLIGETLMRAARPGQAIDWLFHTGPEPTR